MSEINKERKEDQKRNNEIRHLIYSEHHCPFRKAQRTPGQVSEIKKRNNENASHLIILRNKGSMPKKNPEKVWSFAKPGGGSPRVYKKPNLKFANVFFQ